MNFDDILAKLGAKSSGQNSHAVTPPPAPKQPRADSIEDFMNNFTPSANNSMEVFEDFLKTYQNVHIHQEAAVIENHALQNDLFSNSTYVFKDFNFSSINNQPTAESAYKSENGLQNDKANDLMQAVLGSTNVRYENNTIVAESNDLEDIFNMSNLNEAEYQAQNELSNIQHQYQDEKYIRHDKRKKDHNNYIQQQMIPSDILDDLAVRFILNMPMDERDDLIRVCFQMETAYWFYLDFYCAAMKHLPKMKLKRFAQIMFEHIPSLKPMLSSFESIMDNWIKYKFSVPCGGAIMLDKSMRFVLLVQGMSKHWSFPKGKKNQEESLMNCAIREVCFDQYF